MRLFAVTALVAGLLACVPLRAEPPAGPSDDLKTLAAGNNRFAFDLYGKLREKEGNLFFSPASIETALAMTFAGARNRTADEMAATLHFGLPADRLHPAAAEWITAINGDGKAKRPYTLKTANRLWGQSGYKFLDDFRTLTRDRYAAGLEEVDFRGDTEGARKAINAWVEKQTEDRIKDLIPAGVLKPSARLVLTNAVYFQGTWQQAFDADATQDGKFFTAADASVKARLMHQTAGHLYGETADWQALQLPYKGGELAMVVLLPKKRNGLAALEKRLTADEWDKLIGKLGHERRVVVTLPKFKTTAAFKLADELKTLGMKEAFEERKADFRGMNGIPPGTDESLFIRDVIHKAFVAVDEKGTEAAAATAVIVAESTAEVINPKPIPVFRADHPFVFAVRDLRNGAVLFLGRVTDPTKEGE